jgi:FG-GAP-like repeat
MDASDKLSNVTPAAVATVAPQPAPTELLAGAAAPGVDVDRMALPQQYPTWKDSDGWNQPQYYKTIQLADIDKDGQAELIGRGANGIQVYHWNTATQLWDALALEGPLTDDQGWDQEQYYLTIQLADIDNDGYAELFTRDSTGFETRRWNKDKVCWDPPAYTTFANNSAWDQPQYYATLQLADVDGDKKLELVGCGPDGLHLWRWDGNTWVESEAANGSSCFVGWDKQSQYSTIQCADFDGDGQAEVIGRGPSGLSAVRWNKQTSEWDLIEPPADQLAGWTDPQYFTTIQFADIGGTVTLVGRGINGLEFWSWAGSSQNANDWFYQDPVGGPPLVLDYFSDTKGWDKPQNYSTIQFADIDNDGKAELIARGPDGLMAWSAGSWAQLAGPAGIMTDAGGWDAPQSYLTIQAADIDGDGAFEIVGRGSDGIQTWKWGASAPTEANGTPAPTALATPSRLIGFRTAASNGFYQPAVPGFPDYSKSPGQLMAYQCISEYLLGRGSAWPPPVPTDPLKQDIRRQYTNTLLASDWGTFASELVNIKGKTLPGVTDSDFETVRQQLHTELRYVDDAYAWFGNIEMFLTELFDEDKMSVDIVAGYLELSPTSDASVILEYLSLATEALAALAGLFEVMPELVAQLATVASSAFAIGSAASGGDATLQTRVVDLQQQLLHNRDLALTSNGLIQTAYLQHWPLLQKLGEPIESLRLQWPPALTERMATQGRRGYELSLWKTLAPAAGWYVDGHWDEPNEKYKFHYTDASRCPDGDWLFMQCGYWTDPDPARMDRLFAPPTTGPAGDPSGPLGASFEDAVLSRNGWNLTAYTEHGCSLPSAQERLGQMLLRHRRGNPAPRR